MSDLIEFLLARIAEDEAACGGGEEPKSWCDRATGVHHDPARVLAECEAKRRIVERAQSLARRPNMDDETAGRAFEYDDYVLQLLALPYADHPDYREEWRP